MIVLKNIFRTTNKGNIVKNRFFFTKKEHKQIKKTKYTPQQQSQKPRVTTEPLEQLEQEQKKQKKHIFDDQIYLRNLMMANVALGGAIPFYELMNVSIILLNGGFMLSYFGHSVKRFLLLVNSNNFKQLAKQPKPNDYLKKLIYNMLFLSTSSILAAFNYYPIAHLITIGWFGYNIYEKQIPQAYWYMIFPLLFVIGLSIMGYSIKKLIMPSKVDMLVSAHETQTQKK